MKQRIPMFAVILILFQLFLSVRLGAADLELYMADPEVRVAQKIYCQIQNVSASDKLDARLDGNLIFQKNANLQNEEIFIADYQHLLAGSHRLSVHITDASDNILATVTKEWVTLHDGAPRVGINENNAICVDGKPFFPITSFMLDKSKFANWPNNSPFDIASCVNTLYAAGYYPVHDINSWRDYIQSGWRKGWYVAGPGRWDGFDSESPRDSDTDKLAQYVAFTKDTPGLFAWNWDDEPNTGGNHEYNPATTCREWTKITHANDTNHPVWNLYYGYDYTHNGSDWHHARIKEYSYLYNESIFGEKTSVADVISLDYYPYEYDTWQEWVSLEDYVLVLDRAREWNYDLFPVATCIETQDLHDPNAEGHSSPCGWPLRNNRGWTAGPTPQQLENLIWVSIIHGVKSIQLFHWFCPTPKDNITVLVTAKRQITELTDAILASDELTSEVSDEELDGGRIDILAKEYDNKTYIFAANLKEKDESVRMYISGLDAGKSVQVFDEGRIILASDGSFQDNFAPYDVHIYIIPETPISVGNGEKKKVPSNSVILFQNYPNPFNPQTVFSFYVPSRQHVTLKIYDIAGREITTALDKTIKAGLHKVQFRGHDLPNGIYFYQLTTDSFHASGKMAILR